MTVISADLVKILRDKTSVSMMECKKALVQTNGNIDEAIDLLRKSGIAAAVKKQSRAASEGLVAISLSSDKKQIAAVAINCETDFVAKNEKLSSFAQKVADLIIANQNADLNYLATAVEEDRLTLVSQLGENIVLGRAELCTASASETVNSYLHGGASGPYKIASIICLEGGSRELAKDIAMHAAAMRPEYITQADVPKDRLQKEEEICLEQTKANNSDKPADILQKIVAGRVAKFFKEITLVDQIFIKKDQDEEITVAKLLTKHKAKIVKMLRLEVGKK